jgi:hypothetical protein
VQILDKEETLGPDDLIIAVRPWRVKEGRLHAPSELVVNKTQTLAEFRSMFSIRFAGLLQSGGETTEQGHEEGHEARADDYLDIVALPVGSSGPSLTSQRCISLKWIESPFNSTADKTLSAPISELRELRDGAVLVVRSHLAAMAAADAAISDASGQETSEGLVAKPGLGTAVAAKASGRTASAVTVAAPARRERSLRIEVLCPDTSDGVLVLLHSRPGRHRR